MVDDYKIDLYEKYKYYYSIPENVTTLGLMRSVYDLATATIKNKIQYFNHCKFEGFYIIRFRTSFLKELRQTMIFFGKDQIQLKDHLFILHYHLQFGFPNYHSYYATDEEIIDDYCSVYDDFQKIKFMQRLPELIIYQDMFCEKPITDIKLSEAEYKICEKFLLKQLNPNIANILKIEHYPKRGFLRRI